MIVCGYGVVLDSPLGNLYLPEVVKFCQENRPDEIYLCGGPTQQVTAHRLYNRPMSEAQVMKEWILDHAPSIPVVPIRVLGESFTTKENISHASELAFRQMQQEAYMPHTGYRFTIFCETQRALKVILYSRHYLLWLVRGNPDLIRVRTVNWELADPVREVKTTFAAWLDLKYPRLGIGEREGRRRRLKAQTA